MLIRFVVSNFLSFDEETEFNMLPSSLKTHKHHVYKAGKVDVLKSAAIYGANGAGKSNLVMSIRLLKTIVEQGKIEGDVRESNFKLNKINSEKPTSFEIEFTIGKIAYAYGVLINEDTIAEEWLYETATTGNDKLIFERKLSKTGKTTIKIADKYKQTEKQKLLIELMEENLLQNDELFLGKSDQLKISEIIKARRWFSDSLYVIFPDETFEALIIPMIYSDNFNIFANELLYSFDTGVTELGVETFDFESYFGETDEKNKKDILNSLRNKDSIPVKTENETVIVAKENNNYYVKKIFAYHKDDSGGKIFFELDNESDGTRRLLDFIPAFYDIIQRDSSYIIDEIDQSLHPALLYKLISKIMADSETKGQLIFTTHESNLLDLNILRQDEIWFAEKDKIKGSTHLYSLSEYKPRYDLDVRKGYLKGRFGAIPFLGNLDELNWHEYGA